MKKIIACLVFLSLLTSCNVTETVVFTEDGSGEFLVSYDMTEMMAKMKETMGGDTDVSEEKKPGEVMDTTMVFADIMEIYKDSVAALPEEQRLAMEYVKDMYMTMHMDENSGEMNMGIGMKFNSINDLKDIQAKIKKAQSLNSQSGQVDMMKSQTPLGALSGSDDNVDYSYSDTMFSRVTTIAEKTEEELEELNALFKGEDETDKEFLDYFEASYYTVKLVFPKRVKSADIEGAVISEDRKTVTYKTSWMNYIKNPKSLDVAVTFYE
ncbi:hypothetical protein [Winogradskyella haliclonae]|uniref:DUF3347 domain-containing protein n=1 Tax=Winogradskyella haliclonae TaxID=2048558 RepID=A0ABQ2BVB9_9FLAO|nr:hypothetical protein [Winogradskyella haliclonae]GGI55702.1 hypothetical protein GCM10011444_00110 [Winogradskyella haliclonae]